MFEKTIAAMEAGVVHVDARDKDGFTLGVLFVLHPRLFEEKGEHFCLWDKYWALGPSVAFFLQELPSICFYGPPSETFKSLLCCTSALWTDLSFMLQSRMGWLTEEILNHVRHSLRFALISSFSSPKKEFQKKNTYNFSP